MWPWLRMAEWENQRGWGRTTHDTGEGRANSRNAARVTASDLNEASIFQLGKGMMEIVFVASGAHWKIIMGSSGGARERGQGCATRTANFDD